MANQDPPGFEQAMKEVVSYSAAHVHAGGIPFTAFVVDYRGEIIGRGVNRVIENNDPTAHAEVEAIRDACRSIGVHYLSGATLLASGEPCAMCYLNAAVAGIREVVFAVDRDDAARMGFDYRGSYQMLANFPGHWPLKARKHETSNALEPFKIWLKKRSSM